MAKQKAASPKKTEETAPQTEPTAKKKQAKILKRALIISGVKRYEPGTEVTEDMEQAWDDYYMSHTGKAPIRSIDWYC